MLLRAPAPDSKSPSNALELDIDLLEMSKEDLDRDNGKRRHDMSGIDRGPTKVCLSQSPPISNSVLSTGSLVPASFGSRLFTMSYWTHLSELV